MRVNIPLQLVDVKTYVYPVIAFQRKIQSPKLHKIPTHESRDSLGCSKLRQQLSVVGPDVLYCTDTLP